MKTEVEKLDEKNTILLKVEVPTEMFDLAIDEAYKRIAGQMVVPGFRRGKIPKSIIDNRVGRESVKEEALQRALPNYYVDALREVDVEPVDQPEVDVISVEDGKPLQFTAKVKIKPEVKLGEYKGIVVNKPSIEATAEEIDTQIEALRNNFASLEPVEDRPVQNGDYALINFEGFVDNEAFEGGSAEDYLLEIGSETFIPGFEEQIVGMKKDEAKDITVTFPDEYGSDKLAGKEAVFKVLVKEVKVKLLQDLDDEFAKQVGFDTFDELRDDIKNKITGVKVKNVNAEVRGEAVDKVTEAAELEVHDVMIDEELDQMVADFAEDVKRQGLELNQYLEMTGSTVEQLREEWKERADHRVKSKLVLEAIAKQENIEVAEDEVDKEIRKAAEATGRDFEEVKQIFQMQGNIGVLSHRIKLGKTIDWLVENAEIKEVEETKTEEKEDKKGKKRSHKGETGEEKGTD